MPRSSAASSKRLGAGPIAGAQWCAELAALALDARVATIPRRRHNLVHSDTAAAAAVVAFAAGG